MNSESKTRGDRSLEIPERRYLKPPVIEALCEIYFAGSDWDETIPGVFFERVKADFPQKRQRTIQEAQITLGPEQAAAGVRQLPPWMQFVSDEKHRMIQLAQDLLVVNQLAPYPHFEDWEPEIYRAFKRYLEVAKPKSVGRLGVRYINRVVIPGERVQMEDYLSQSSETSRRHARFVPRSRGGSSRESESHGPHHLWNGPSSLPKSARTGLHPGYLRHLAGEQDLGHGPSEGRGGTRSRQHRGGVRGQYHGSASRAL